MERKPIKRKSNSATVEKRLERLELIMEDVRASLAVLAEAANLGIYGPRVNYREGPRWRAKWAADADVLRIVLARFTSGKTIDATRKELIDTFGENRTPSRASLGRFRRRLLLPPENRCSVHP